MLITLGNKYFLELMNYKSICHTGDIVTRGSLCSIFLPTPGQILRVFNIVIVQILQEENNIKGSITSSVRGPVNF